MPSEKMTDSDAWIKLTNRNWTDEEIRYCIFEAARLGFLKAANTGIDELIRRRQEQCAVIADEKADQCRLHARLGYPSEADLTAEIIAESIRELK